MNHFYHLVGETQDKLVFVDGNFNLNFPSVFCKYSSIILILFFTQFLLLGKINESAVMRSSVMFRNKRSVGPQVPLNKCE